MVWISTEPCAQWPQLVSFHGTEMVGIWSMVQCNEHEHKSDSSIDVAVSIFPVLMTEKEGVKVETLEHWRLCQTSLLAMSNGQMHQWVCLHVCSDFWGPLWFLFKNVSWKHEGTGLRMQFKRQVTCARQKLHPGQCVFPPCDWVEGCTQHIITRRGGRFLQLDHKSVEYPRKQRKEVWLFSLCMCRGTKSCVECGLIATMRLLLPLVGRTNERTTSATFAFYQLSISISDMGNTFC